MLAAQRLLLLPLPINVKFSFLPPEIRRAFALERITVDRKRVIDGNLVIHELPHGGKSQSFVLQLQVLEVGLLLIRPAQSAGELVPVLLDRQGGRTLLVAD